MNNTNLKHSFKNWLILHQTQIDEIIQYIEQHLKNEITTMYPVSQCITDTNNLREVITKYMYKTSNNSFKHYAYPPGF